MDRDPIGTAIRRTRRHARLGGSPLTCLLCGYANPLALIAVRRNLLENHHVVGEKHDPELTALLCRNCHAELTEGLLQESVSMRPEPDPRARVALMLDALAVFLEVLTAAVRRWAKLMRSVVSPEATND